MIADAERRLGGEELRRGDVQLGGRGARLAHQRARGVEFAVHGVQLRQRAQELALGLAVGVVAALVLKPLLELGVVPDFTAVVDFQGQTKKFFETLPASVPTRLVAVGPAFHDTVRSYPGPLAFAGDPLMDRLLAEADRDQLGGGEQEFPPVRGALRRAQVEGDARVDAAVAEMPVQRGAVAVAVHQRLEFAQVAAQGGCGCSIPGNASDTTLAALAATALFGTPYLATTYHVGLASYPMGILAALAASIFHYGTYTVDSVARTVVLERSYGAPQIINSGVIVAKEVELEDPFENMGAQMVKEVAEKTSDIAGDGTTTATVLAESIYREGLKFVTSGANPIGIQRGITKAVEAAGGSFEAVKA